MTPEQQLILTIIGIVIAGISLVASFISVFFQFLHKPRRIRVITMPLDSYKTFRFGICNGGGVNIFLTGVFAKYYWPPENASILSVGAGPVACSKKILTPGDVVEHSFDVQSPKKEILKNIPLSTNEQGKKERKLYISVDIHFAFPDGKVYSNKFNVGEYTISEDGMSHGYSIYALNLDLRKKAVRLKAVNKQDTSGLTLP